jgi:hypothetical protein
MRDGGRRKLAVLVAVLASIGLAPAAQAGLAPAAQTGIRPAARFSSLCGAMGGMHPATISHVMFIVMENRSYPTVVGSKKAPYLNNTLIPGCGLATNYHNYSHPSTPNYLVNHAALPGVSLVAGITCQRSWLARRRHTPGAVVCVSRSGNAGLYEYHSPYAYRYHRSS